MVLLNNTHNCLSEIGHVFTDVERNVTTWLFLVMSDRITELVTGPASIFRRSELVITSHEHCNGNNCFDCGQVYDGWLRCTVMFHVLFFTGVIKISKVVLLVGLTVVNQGIYACSRWEMTHIYLESVLIICIKIVSSDSF